MSVWGGVRRLAATDDLSNFECGVHALDDYFRRHARKNDLMGLSNCFVLLKPPGTDYPELCGFFTLSGAGVDHESVGAILEERLPARPVSVCLVGRFAIHRLVERKGGGEYMLVSALKMVAESAVGFAGVIIDAKNDRSMSFYRKYGFVPLLQEESPHFPRRLFLARSAIPT